MAITRFRNERHFQNSVNKVARIFGWLHYHTYDSRRSQRGFPDLVLIKGNVCLFRELKMPKGELTKEQAAWGAALMRAGQDWAVWRPSDWDEIINRLQRT